MSQASDFVIQDDVLLDYRGTDGTVVVPDGVSGIRAKAFQGSDVEEVILPEGLEWMGVGALSDCPCLRRLVLPATLRVVPPKLCYGSKTLTEVLIPEGVTVLSDQAFSVTGLRHVEIPDSVRIIGNYCFNDSWKLKTVYPGNGVQEVGEYAFTFCANLQSISLPASLRVIRDAAFKHCTSLRSVRMEPGLLSVGSSVFENCPALEELDFPDTLENLSPDVFGKTPAMERITFRGNRVRIRGYSFTCLATVIRAPRMRPNWLPFASQSAALKGFLEMKAEGWPLDPNIAEAWEAYATGTGPVSSGKPAAAFQIVDGILCGVSSPEGRVVVPEGVTGIRAEAFHATAVREVWLPDSVNWIQPGVFENCRQLREVRLPAGLTRIPGFLFEGCPNLRSLPIPEGVVHIDEHAFFRSGLEAITLPSTLKIIDHFAFYACRQLKEVRFPQGLQAILCGAFDECSSLREATLPDSLEVLEWGAFGGCTALKRVSLGSRLRHPHHYAFTDCGMLEEISFSADLCSIGFGFCNDSPNLPRLRLHGSFADLEDEGLPSRIVTPNADPTILNAKQLRSLLRGFALEDGKGFRYEAEYMELLRSHRREVWGSEEVLRFLLRHDLLEREEIPECLEALQGDPTLVAEVLEYGHRRFPEPAAPLFLE